MFINVIKILKKNTKEKIGFCVGGEMKACCC